MKQYVSQTAVALLLATAATAQPVMNLGDAPMADEHFTYRSAAYLPVTASGENAVWDLSAMQGSEQPSLTGLDPEATAYGDLFPTATVALDDGNNLLFLRADNSGLYTVGRRVQVGGIHIEVGYSDDMLMLPYPCTYNTAYADTFAYSYDFTDQGGQQQTALGSGNTGYTADGFGSLVLPYDTIHNVLKLTGVDSLTESIPGTSYLTVSDNVYFYKPGIHYFVLRATESTQFVNGDQTQTGQGITYLSEEAFAGIRESVAQAIGIEAWPLPARDILNVSYGLAGGRKVDIRLFDATGSLVRDLQDATAASGIQRAALDVTGLPAGIYLLRLTDDRGQAGTLRVVVQ